MHELAVGIVICFGSKTENVPYRMDSAIAPDRHSASAERVDSSFVLPMRAAAAAWTRCGISVQVKQEDYYLEALVYTRDVPSIICQNTKTYQRGPETGMRIPNSRRY